MKKFVFIIKIVFCCLSFIAGMLFFMAYYYPNNNLFLNFAYPLSAFCALSLFIYSLIRIINMKKGNQSAKQQEKSIPEVEESNDSEN